MPASQPAPASTPARQRQPARQPASQPASPPASQPASQQASHQPASQSVSQPASQPKPASQPASQPTKGCCCCWTIYLRGRWSNNNNQPKPASQPAKASQPANQPAKASQPASQSASSAGQPASQPANHCQPASQPEPGEPAWKILGEPERASWCDVSFIPLRQTSLEKSGSGLSGLVNQSSSCPRRISGLVPDWWAQNQPKTVAATRPRHFKPTRRPHSIQV